MASAVRGLAAARRATVRICTRSGEHKGQGLLLDLPGEESGVVLTCHHVIAPVDPDELRVAILQSSGELGVPVPARYDAARSRPGRDAVVLRVTSAPLPARPALDVLDPATYDGGLPRRATGLTYLQPDNFDARVAASTALVLPAKQAGRWPGAPERYELRAFRLADPTDARPGISGAVVVYEGGVLGLTHFARSAGAAHEREAYLVALGTWAEGWEALARCLESRTPPTPQGPAAPAGVDMNRRTLRDAIVGAFDVEDLEVLCTDVQQDLRDDGIILQVNLDMVGGRGKELRVQNLIEYLDRRSYLGYLVRAVRRARPALGGIDRDQVSTQ